MSMSLPTPPRTTQKNKENLPPTPFTPASRTPRIVWSQENLHHAYSTQVRQLPSSSRAKAPQKSILKKPSLPLISHMLTEEPAHEVTPEPADPLQHPLYLNSPVSTLVASFQPGSDSKISLADLTEAYSVLSARLKTKMHTMIEMCGPIPALEPLREHSNMLLESFHRDIGRAFVNPQSHLPQRESSPYSSPSSVDSAKKRGYTEQEVKHARDLCNLSHAAMRCFSNIALVPVLSSIFSDSQLGDMLTDVLAIPLAPALPTPNARKTCQIAIWTLQAQRLPMAVLEPAADRIAYALRRGIDGELGREGKKGSASDGLKAVAVLSSNQPATFLQPFSDIVPSVFSHLTSQNLALRLQAAHAVLSLSHALARLASPDPVLLESFRLATSTYLTSQQNMRKSPQDLSPLGKEFRACFEVDTPMHAAQSPIWALSVIAAFIVLSDGSAFTHPKTIKFILGHLRTAMGVKRTTVRATAGLVWRALVWACVRLDSSEQSQVHKDAGWKVVRQILDGAIGISVVAALVGQKGRQERRVVQALEVVKMMIKKGGRTCEEGVDVLERLLSAVGSGVEETCQDMWSNNKLLVEPLFDGTLLQAEWKGLVSHVKDALNQCVVIQDISPLQEDEVVQNWEALFTIWKDAVERAPLGRDGEAPPAILNAWQALLLTQAQLTQGFEHVTSTPGFILHLTDLLKSFLNDSSLEWSLDSTAPCWSSQPLKLGFVRNLWTVTRNVFATSTLAGAAQAILCEVLGQEYLLGQDEVRDAWAALCSELVLSGSPGLVRELWSERDHDLDINVNRGLWRIVSKQWINNAGPWDGAIELLRAPFTLPVNWSFDKEDLELWVRLLDCTLLSACARKISSIRVLDAIASEIGADHNNASLYAALPYLLSGIDASPLEHQNPPQHPEVLLRLTNDVLLASYPPSDPGSKRMLLAVFESLKEIIRVTCKELLVRFLVHIQDGVRVWITDEKEAFTKDEYNEQIISFYVASLEMLKKLPADVEMLHSLCPLLISAFNRIPEPALGPSAFKAFWTEAYNSSALRPTSLPEDLKPIVRAIHDTMYTADEQPGYSLSTETQTQDLETVELPSLVVPDSLQESGRKIQETCSDMGRLSNPDAFCQHVEVPQKFEQRSGTPPPFIPHPCTDDGRVANIIVDTTSGSPPEASIKKEYLDTDHETALMIGSSQSPLSSQRFKASPALGKRRRSHLSLHSSKKRKSIPGPGVEIINISDDDDSEQVALDLSIVVVPAKRRKSLETQTLSQRTCQPSTPKSERHSPDLSSSRKKRTIFEAVELPTLQGLLKQQNASLALCKAPCQEKTMTGTRFISQLWHDKCPEAVEQRPGPSKRQRTVDPCNRDKKRAAEDWSDESLPHSTCFSLSSSLKSCDGDANIQYTPEQPSESSIPSSRAGKISAGHVFSPLPRRSRSEAYDPPSDEHIPSSPLKQAAARRLQRARTMPILPTHALLERPEMPARPAATRMHSEEFLALEHAHVVVSSGASRMGLQELLEANQMVSKLSTVLGDEMTKKIPVEEDHPGLP